MINGIHKHIRYTYIQHIYMMYIWHSPGQPHPPTPGMVMVPCLAPCGSGWGGCRWVGMLVDGVVVLYNPMVFARNSIKCGNKGKREASSLMMGQ